MELEMTEREKRVREKLCGKKIVCYGVSASYTAMNELLDLDESVAFFADRDQSKWGRFYYGKEVKSPDEMSRLDKRTYIVIVFVRTFEPVYKLLNDMGFEHKVNYIHISELLGVRYELVKFINTANMLVNFLDTVPEALKGVTPKKESEKIGIIASMEGLGAAPDFPYSIVLFLILKWKGYHVQLIMDNLCWTVDTDLYEGCHEDLQYISQRIMEKLRAIVPQSDILYLNAYGSGDVTESDKRECEKIAEYSARHQKWMGFHDHIRTISQAEEQEYFTEAFKRNIGYVNAFFEKKHFHTINASTGLHKRAGVISYVARKKGIRVSSQDGWRGNMLVETGGPASHGGDISRTINENWIPKEREEGVLQCASKLAEKRFMQSNSGDKFPTLRQFQMEVGSKGYANVTLQSAKREIKQKYDVIIPLNAAYDAAALGLEDIFQSREEWLIETLDFVIHTLKKSVLLREHPILKMLPKPYLPSDLASTAQAVLEPYRDNELLHYADIDEDLNLYQYIEQCKVVLPWSSTVGVEAAVMQKNVIVHTNVYYGNSAFAMKARSKREYFSLVQECTGSNEWLVADKKTAYREALKYFYFGMKRRLKTKFTLYAEDLECITHEWMGMKFEELLEEKGVFEITQIVAENVPSVYLTEQQQ